ncbi:hypothetical protein BH09PAT1_BH09PAT1_8420 [soil metagenome]
MTVKDLLNNSKTATFLIGNYMVWKHSQGWSASDITTDEYFLDMQDWDENKKHMPNTKGTNYWTDIDAMLRELEKHL